MERRYSVGDAEVRVRIDTEGDTQRVTVGDHVYLVRVVRADDDGLTLDIDGRRVRAVVARDGHRRWVTVGGRTLTLEPGTGRRGRRGTGGGDDSLTAAMPGQVVAVYVATGDSVERGQKLASLEAMKMELSVTAPHTGIVRAVRVTPGDVVRRGQPLIEIHPT
ncbi:MAG: HlyD family efflux transporter periplasmic adaptor subunit [Anaerolineae bacterium]|nr:HlyD family efflux transporter periplasmic adaptor subunit [Anaerolineae bacterium]